MTTLHRCSMVCIGLSQFFTTLSCSSTGVAQAQSQVNTSTQCLNCWRVYEHGSTLSFKADLLFRLKNLTEWSSRTHGEAALIIQQDCLSSRLKDLKIMRDKLRQLMWTERTKYGVTPTCIKHLHDVTHSFYTVTYVTLLSWTAQNTHIFTTNTNTTVFNWWPVVFVALQFYNRPAFKQTW